MDTQTAYRVYELERFASKNVAILRHWIEIMKYCWRDTSFFGMRTVHKWHQNGQGRGSRMTRPNRLCENAVTLKRVASRLIEENGEK